VLICFQGLMPAPQTTWVSRADARPTNNMGFHGLLPALHTACALQTGGDFTTTAGTTTATYRSTRSHSVHMVLGLLPQQPRRGQPA
jgi:hypothetical protein